MHPRPPPQVVQDGCYTKLEQSLWSHILLAGNISRAAVILHVELATLAALTPNVLQ